LKIQSYYRCLDDIVYARIEAEAVDNAESLGSIRHPLHSRLVGSLPRTSASVDWDHFEPWAEETWYESPDIADVIQEVVDRAGWSPNNSLTILYSNRDIEGGYRNFFSYDLGRNHAPKLKITYAIE
jgi:type IV pilus assembly protein PilY1